MWKMEGVVDEGNEGIVKRNGRLENDDGNLIVKKSIDEILIGEADGFRSFQWRIWVITGLGWVFHATDVLSQVYVIAGLTNEWSNVGEFELSFLGSATFFGWAFGAYFCGAAADKYGRKPVFLGSCGFAVFFAYCGLISPFYWYVLLYRFWIGCATGSLNAIAFNVVSEVVDIKNRDASLTFWHIWFAIGEIFLSLMGLLVYSVLDYDQESSVAYKIVLAPFPFFGIIVFFLVLFFVPESPRYLLVNGDEDKALSSMQDIVRCNTGLELPKKIALPSVKSTKQKGSLYQVFFTNDKISEIGESTESSPLSSYPSSSLSLSPSTEKEEEIKEVELVVGKTMVQIRKCLLIQWVAWFATAMVYYGTTLSSTNKDNISLALLISSVVEIPAAIIVIPLNLRFGRRFATASTLISCGICLLVLLIPWFDGVWITIMSNLAKFFITMTFDTIFLYAAELFPTSLRAVCCGSSNSAGRIGALLAPFLAIFIHGVAGEEILFMIFGVVSTGAGLLCFLLPETQGLHLVDR